MNEITFGQEYMPVFKELAYLEEESKSIKKKLDAAKAELLKAMEENNIKEVENDFVKITYVAATESWAVDWKAFEFEEPEMYEEIAKKFNKKKFRKAYVRVTPR